ncbi:MAG: cytochrome c3 family protein [Fidelibacterota bacterium]
MVQPISFNHEVHVEGEDLDCTLCHTQVMKRSRATLPRIKICQKCHYEPITETESERTLLAFASEGREVPWRRIYQVPRHVYFSHRRHVKLGNIPCESCHGDVRKLTEPPEYPLIAPTMGYCTKCHEEHQITNDCLACHR